MNPAFLIIVVIVLIALWFLLSFSYHSLGKFLYRIWKDAVNEINRKDESEDKS